MVSLRRRRYLGLCSGKSSFEVIVPPSTENGKVTNTDQNVKSASVHMSPETSKQEISDTPSDSTLNAFSLNSVKQESISYYPDKEVKRRKRHRRKQYVDREPCVMRGVYFKNMKWQAAIKVDKKQIHLGTVGSQDEAARLYDRAAFMCGREPNFELNEDDKRELRKLSWDEFLAMTRNNITTKRQRKLGIGKRKESQMKDVDEMKWVHDDGSSSAS